MSKEEMVRRTRTALAEFAALPPAEQMERMIDWRLADMDCTIGDWHCTADSQWGGLLEALGMTEQEYAEFVADPRRFVLRHYLTDEADAEARGKEAV